MTNTLPATTSCRAAGAAGFGEDGNDCVIAINGNCRFNPTEVFEARFPFRVEECAMVTDSGGAGQWRGGLGYTRTLLATSVTITGSQCSDRHEVKPWALFGGGRAAMAARWSRKAGSEDWQTVKELYGKVSSSKFANVRFQPGDRIKLTTPGGGGYGDPQRRAPAKVREDVREGYVSSAAAEREYGLREPNN